MHRTKPPALSWAVWRIPARTEICKRKAREGPSSLLPPPSPLPTVNPTEIADLAQILSFILCTFSRLAACAPLRPLIVLRPARIHCHSVSDAESILSIILSQRRAFARKSAVFVAESTLMTGKRVRCCRRARRRVSWQCATCLWLYINALPRLYRSRTWHIGRH
jgi:hypothetical protein